MDNTMNQAAALASMCHNQSVFLAESVTKPICSQKTLTEKEIELEEYFRKYGTSSK